MREEKPGEAVATAYLGQQLNFLGNEVLGTQTALDALQIAEKALSNQAIGIVYDLLASCYISDLAKFRMYEEKALPYATAAGDDFTITGCKMFECKSSVAVSVTA